MAQYARPTSDVSFSLLGGHSVDSAGNRYQNIDEPSPAVDTDYVYSQNNPGGASNAEFGLSSLTDTGSDNGFILRIRTAQIDEDGGAHPRPADTGGTATSCAWELRQGATVIESGSINPGAFATTTVNLSSANIANITNFADLRVYVSPSGGGGSPANRRAVAVSWVELEGPSGFTTNAVVKKTLSGSSTADATIEIIVSGSFTADAVIPGGATTIEDSVTADAIIHVIQSASFTADAMIKSTLSGSLTADAVISITVSGSVTADAVVQDTQTGSITADAVVGSSASASFAADAILAATQSGSFTADAVILATTSAAITADAAIATVVPGSLTADSIVSGTVGDSLSADSIIAGTVALSFIADAWIEVAGQASLTMDAVLSAVTSASFTADAFIGETGNYVVIKVNDVDVTASIILADAKFETSAMGVPGSCSFRIRDLTNTWLFKPGAHLTLDVDGLRTWGGYITQIHRGYFFDGTPNHCDPIVPTHWTISGVDYNILLTKRVLYDKDDERERLTVFEPGTPDNEVIDYYITNHTDLLADGVSLSGVVHVGTPSTDFVIDGRPSESILDFLRRMAFNTSAIFYIDPDKTLVFCDVDSANAPATISDRPAAGEVGCRDLTVDFNGSKLVNDALVWGAGQGSDVMKFSRVTDQESIDTHALWQTSLFSSSMFRQATVDRTASSYVYGSPQSKRGGKDDAVGLRCTIFESGFRVAQKVPFHSQVFGFADVLPIRRMEVTFPTTTSAKFALTISHEIDSPWVGYEWWFPPIPTFQPRRWTIRIPGAPQFVDENGNGIGGTVTPVCIGGRVTYTGTFATGDAGEVYGFDNPGPYSPFINLRYNRGGFPRLDDPSTLGYLGYNAYLVDGNPGTFMLGYRLQTSDSVTWDLRVPLSVAGASIVQGVGSEQFGSGRYWKEHWVSDRITLWSKYNDGYPWVKRGDTGYIGTYANNVGLEVGQGSQTYSGGYLLPDGTPVPQVPGTGHGLAIARYWTATSEAPYFSVRNFGTGVVHGGERAWHWIVNEAHLFAHCAQFESVSPGSAGSDEVPLPIPPPAGEDPTRSYFYLSEPWILGTLVVYADGLYVPPTVYAVNHADQWVSLPASYGGSEISIRYIALGS